MTIEVGDIVNVKGKDQSWIGKMISWFTDSEFTHTAVVVAVNNDDVAVVEAQWLNFNDSVYSYEWIKNNAKYGSFKKFDTEDDKILFIYECMKLIGKPYDYPAILTIGANILYRRYILRQDKETIRKRLITYKSSKLLFCSEAISRICKMFGVDLCPELDDDMITPGDIAESEVIKWKN